MPVCNWEGNVLAICSLQFARKINKEGGLKTAHFNFIFHSDLPKRIANCIFFANCKLPKQIVYSACSESQALNNSCRYMFSSGLTAWSAPTSLAAKSRNSILSSYVESS